MADTKISALTAVTVVADANEFAVNEAGVSKKASGAQVKTFVAAPSLGLIVATTMGMNLP